MSSEVIFLEHKLLSEVWLEFMGSGGRKTVSYDVPAEGTRGLVPEKWKTLPIGEAVVRRSGGDLTIISVGVGVHRALEAASLLENDGIATEVLDLRTVSPLDKKAVCNAVQKTGHLPVVDEDYETFGLSGELSAVVLESGITCKYARVCTQTTIPYARSKEDHVIPDVQRIRDAALTLGNVRELF